MTCVTVEAMNYKRPPGLISALGRAIIESFIDPSATLADGSFAGWYSVIQARVRVGARSKVWHGARLLADVVVGEDCMIGGGTEIGAGSVIGDRSRIQANCFFPSGTVIGRNVFIGPGVTCTDDRFPRVPSPGDPPYVAEPPVIGDNVAIGAGAVLLPGVKIGTGARVAAGTLVVDDVPPYTMAMGLPSRERQMPEAWRS